jgi:hypothetical protein
MITINFKKKVFTSIKVKKYILLNIIVRIWEKSCLNFLRGRDLRSKQLINYILFINPLLLLKQYFPLYLILII